MVSDQVTRKPACTVSKDGLKFWIFEEERGCTSHVSKTKALISCAVTVKLICAFVFASDRQKSGFLMTQLIYYAQLATKVNHIFVENREIFFCLVHLFSIVNTNFVVISPGSHLSLISHFIHKQMIKI